MIVRPTAEPQDGAGARAPVDLEALSDLITPWCLRVAVTLKVAERVDAGTTDVDDLAQATGSDPHALRMVLEHLVTRGVFEEPQSGRFLLNDAARLLLDPVLSAYERLFGLPFWEDLEAPPRVGASFDDLMGPAGHGLPDASFDISGGWRSVRSVVDVGGGTGAMLAELLRLHPGLRGTLVDLPRSVAASAEVFRAAGVASRVAAVGQSFFEPLPAGADLYLLRKVINDWPDHEAVAILRRCAEAAGSGGRVVVLRGMGEDETPQAFPVEAILAGGRRRSVSDLRELARLAGLEVVSAERHGWGYLVVECRPVAAGAGD